MMLTVAAVSIHAYYSADGVSYRSNNTKVINKPLGQNSMQPVDDPNRTTSRLVGNGLVYFVFWFFGAPVLIIAVFVFFLFTGLLASPDGFGWILFIVLLFGLTIGWLYHTAQIIQSGFNASIAPDTPGEKLLIVQPSQTNSEGERIPCPMCAEKILPQAKICHFCKSILKP